MNNKIINYKKTNPNAITPTKGTEYAAGYDLYAIAPEEGVAIEPGQTVKIGTGISMEIPEGYGGFIFARSGLATKQGLRPANCVGVVDSDYRGEIIVALYNDSDEKKVVNNKDRVAQLVLMPYLMHVDLVQAETLNETIRGDGGFGSTDKIK